MSWNDTMVSRLIHIKTQDIYVLDGAMMGLLEVNHLQTGMGYHPVMSRHPESACNLCLPPRVYRHRRWPRRFGEGCQKGHMASGITSDGKTVTVTTDEGHRIGFGMAELNADRTSGDITTKWNGGVPPTSIERTVAAAKIGAEAYSA